MKVLVGLRWRIARKLVENCTVDVPEERKVLPIVLFHSRHSADSFLSSAKFNASRDTSITNMHRLIGAMRVHVPLSLGGLDRPRIGKKGEAVALLIYLGMPL